ncbi:methionine synthase I (cobalamin-dependent) [Kineosphaera limosa]|uniref:homocysteine S-methyltransferase family protein n=1 Tax=Kineosphaera limosa TaxID=111564 RepID=UPI00030ED216|nr:homocysteine S-methyltransferase family protein [Kineosphaera limosa]NYE00684.1 methionine synthase I (cobalamin-dependent) [Kineosphaera limosa]
MTTNRFATLLADRAPVFDGGYGWLLQERGLPAGDCAELWNLQEPEKIAALHDEYAAAGASVLTTNTFGGTAPRLAMHGLEDHVEAVNRAGAAIAREVADRHGALVGGDLGPTGELFEPMGTLTPEQAQGLFEAQLRGLVAGGIDLVLIETMSDLAEARAAIAAARAVCPDLPIVATMSFDTNLRTMMGVRPADAALELAAAGADVVGANCGRGPEEMSVIAEQLVAARPEGVLVLTQSNAGLPQLEGAEFVYTVGPQALAEHARSLRDAGVDVVGACCGSSPEHIAAIRAAVTA